MLNSSQVIEWQRELEDDAEHRQYRELMQRREAIVAMRLPPELSQRLKDSGDISVLNSPSLLQLALTKRSKWNTFDTHLTVFNRDGMTQEHQARADALEKKLVACMGNLNSGNHWFADKYINLLLSSWDIDILHCGADDLYNEWTFPYAIEKPDPRTCFFPIQGGPFRPPVLALRYKMTVGDAEKLYSGKKSGPLEGAAIRFNASGKSWVKFGDDHEADAAYSTSGKRHLQLVEFIKFYDGKDVYHIAKAGAEGSGPNSGDLMVWSSKERTGGVPAVVSSGITLTSRSPGERLAPALWPGYQYLAGLNDIRARRATMADRVIAPEGIIQDSAPGIMEDALSGVKPIRMSAGDFLFVNGKYVDYGKESADLDKLEQSWSEEYREFRQANTDIDDPELYTKGTANVQLQQIQARGRLDTEPIGNKDWACQQIMEMLLVSMKTYKGSTFKLMAQGDVNYGRQKKLKAGESYSLEAGDFDFNYVIKVETQQVTAQEKRLEVESEWEDYSIKGISTFSQVLDRKYDDPGEQWKNLAEDAAEALLEAETFTEARLKEIAADLAWLEGGYAINDPMAQQQAMIAAHGAGGAGESAATGAPGGGSSGNGRGVMPLMEAPAIPGGQQGDIGTGVS